VRVANFRSDKAIVKLKLDVYVDGALTHPLTEVLEIKGRTYVDATDDAEVTHRAVDSIYAGDRRARSRIAEERRRSRLRIASRRRPPTSSRMIRTRAWRRSAFFFGCAPVAFEQGGPRYTRLVSALSAIFSQFAAGELIWKSAGPDCTMVLLDATRRRPGDVIMDDAQLVVRSTARFGRAFGSAHAAALLVGGVRFVHVP
jgi:hypothetical protein